MRDNVPRISATKKFLDCFTLEAFIEFFLSNFGIIFFIMTSSKRLLLLAFDTEAEVFLFTHTADVVWQRTRLA